MSWLRGCWGPIVRRRRNVLQVMKGRLLMYWRLRRQKLITNWSNLCLNSNNLHLDHSPCPKPNPSPLPNLFLLNPHQQSNLPSSHPNPLPSYPFPPLPNSSNLYPKSNYKSLYKNNNNPQYLPKPNTRSNSSPKSSSQAPTSGSKSMNGSRPPSLLILKLFLSPRSVPIYKGVWMMIKSSRVISYPISGLLTKT